MQRFVLMILLVAAGIGATGVAAGAQEAKAIVEKYGKDEGATSASLDRKTFNLMKPFLGLDKETRQLFKVLNFKTIDILSVKASPQADAALRELDALVSDSLYVGFRADVQDKESGKESTGTAIFKESDGYITDFVIYSRHPKDSVLMVLCIECSAKVDELKEKFSRDGEE